MATILITGVTSGIGRALAIEFAKQGHTVIGCGTREDKISELNDTLGSHHRIDRVDVSDYHQVEQWAHSVHKTHPKIDIVINNAGVKSKLVPTWEVEPADFKRTIDINVLGVFNVIHSFVPAMVKSNHGTIINMSSEWGRVTDANVSSYCASKYAIEGLTQSLSKELPSNMIAIALSPLIVYTKLLEQVKHLLLPGEYELGVTPEEWAKYVVPKIFALNKEDNGKSLTWSPKYSDNSTAE